MTSYIQQVDQHWTKCVQIAKSSGANKIQLDCLVDLAETEFKYDSGMRLSEHCFWSTKVDRDGDVVLSFIQPHELIDGLSVHGARVNVCIDFAGIISTKNLDTERTIIYDPYIKLNSVPDHPPVWALEHQMLTPFTVPSATFGFDPLGNRYCIIQETGKVLWPFLYGENAAEIQGAPEPDVKVLDITEYYGGAPIQGYLLRGHKLYWFTEYYTDDVSGDTFFALHEIRSFKKLKVFLKYTFPRIMSKLCVLPHSGYLSHQPPAAYCLF
jgi:hypothetical protein